MNDDVAQRIVDFCDEHGWPQHGNAVLRLGPDNDEWGFQHGKDWIPFSESDIYAIHYFVRWLERKLLAIEGTEIGYRTGWSYVIFNPTMENPERDDVLNGEDHLDVLLRAANMAVKYKWL